MLDQTVSDWEMIVVDDGSTDTTAQIAEGYAAGDPRIRVFRKAHQGVTKSRIEAMGLACGELFARLDADDCMLPQYLERVDALFHSHPDAQLVSTNGYQVFADGTRVYYYKDPLFQQVTQLTLKDMLEGHLIGTSAVMSRSVYELTGGPRPEARSEDVDLWYRAIAMGAVHYHLPDPVFLYYQDAKNRVSADIPAVWRSHVEIIENLMSEGLVPESLLPLALRTVRRYQLKLAMRWDLWGIPARKALARTATK